MIAILLVSLQQEVLGPILSARSHDGYFARLSDCWKKFQEALAGFRVLRRASSAEFELDPNEFMREMRASVHTLSGPDAVDEFDFDVATYLRAMALARELRDSPLEREEDKKKDQEFARVFNAHGDLFQFALFAIAASAENHPTSVAVECSFELLRGSALRAYIAVRQGAELRKAPDSVDITPGPFDEEDCRLAGITPRSA
jgi:hypothetical protein